MLDEENRQRITLHQEGLVLANAGNCGASSACEVAQCQMDGIANALIRIQGAKQTAMFVFALSDRVSGGVRDVTDCFPQLAPLVVDVPPPLEKKRLPDFAWGFLCGLAVMVAVTMLAMGRV